MKKSILVIVGLSLLRLSAFGENASSGEGPEGFNPGELPNRIAYTKVYLFQPKPVSGNLSSEQKAAQEFLARLQKQLVKIEVVKTGAIKKETQYFDNGTVMEVWKSGEFSFSINSQKPGQIIVFSPAMLAHPESAPADPGELGELAWITKNNLHGVETRQGLECIVYKAGDQTAWIDKKTHLPVYYISSKMQVSYSYQGTPVQDLVLPEKFSKKLEAVKQSWIGRCN